MLLPAWFLAFLLSWKLFSVPESYKEGHFPWIFSFSRLTDALGGEGHARARFQVVMLTQSHNHPTSPVQHPLSSSLTGHTRQPWACMHVPLIGEKKDGVKATSCQIHKGFHRD